MLRGKMRHLRGAFVTLLLVVNLALCGTPIFLLGLIKRLIPVQRIERRLVLFGVWIAEHWVAGNDRLFDFFLPTRWTTDAGQINDRNGHCLIISNHRSWVDILVLQRIFHGHAPFLRFFLKQELLWLPILGQACWALDFPFMKRYTPEYLELHPEKRGTDLATTRRACSRYRQMPVSILNFVEGTRFSKRKRDEQGAPYRHLLEPRTGGIAFVVASLGDQLEVLYDVTLAYPGVTDITFWDFVTGRVPSIETRVRRREIPERFFDAAVTERGPLRSEFKLWISEMWREKDELLEELHAAE
jgi:1-acyl-sn-glycerol-3-phosphate acyltransferase